MSIVIVMGPLLVAMVAAVTVFAASKIAERLGVFRMSRVAFLTLGAVLLLVLVWPMTQWYTSLNW